ncbi:MAG: SDR family NAD(P)-dependent oxidoreductase [Cyanobacteria bacterium P01_G01_bin.39]
MQSQQTGLEIAIIGISGRFPGSKNIDIFWENLINGEEFISVLNKTNGEKQDLNIESNQEIKAAGLLEDIEQFDASFFGLNPREAEIMDPQHRLFLECAWSALEDAGYDSEREERSIGVYAGVGRSTYLLYNLFPNNLNETLGYFPILLASDKDYVPTRVSYKLNLKGPSVSVGTACSSSLVAVHLASQSLLSGDCDIALAAGVSVKAPQNEATLCPEGISPDGRCFVFDARANGTIGGSGIGVVVLKRLEDAIADRDYIYSVIKGSALNNDGAVKVSYTAPSEEAQARVIRAAQIMAEVEPETISYIETHGTGTSMGDPIEFAGLKQAFSTDKKGYCAIGSVKTNIGHLDAAAGIAGLIKTSLALERKLLPPSLNFETPNPEIDFENSPFFVNTKLSEWQANGSPRRAGVSSFGFGGTNAHVVLEEAPLNQLTVNTKQLTDRKNHLLVLSAKTSSALETATTNLTHHLKQHSELNLADVAYTLQVGRRAFNYRRAVVCRDLEDAVNALSDPKRILTSIEEVNDRPMAFMFTGLGTHYLNMGLELYQLEPVFREQVDRCCEFLKPLLDLDLRDIIYPNRSQASEGYQASNSTKNKPQSSLDLRKMLGRDRESTDETTQQLNQTYLTQPAVFVIEYALAQLWMSWGIRPVAMIGYSIGEYVAATLAGVLSLEDALTLVAKRAQMIQDLPGGSMLAVPLSEEEVRPLLGDRLSLSAINGAKLCVIAGDTDTVEELADQLTEQGLVCRHLQTSHAFHSQMMEPIASSLTELVKTVSLKPPQIPYLSNVTGTWITEAEATDPSYWTKHMCQAVRFTEGLHELWKQQQPILLEVGPGQTLSSSALQCLESEQVADRVVLPSLRDAFNQQSDLAFLLNTLGKLWFSGVEIDWSGFYAHEQRHRLPLPTYPFERQRYWIDTPKQATKQSLTTAPELWSSLVKTGQSQANISISESEQQAYQENQQLLDNLCAAYMNLALRNLGAFSSSDDQYSFEELWEQYQIVPRYRPLLSQWLQKLVQQENLQQHQRQFANLASCSTETVATLLEEVKLRWQDSLSIVNLIERCGDNLAAVLMGKQEPLGFFDGFLYNYDAVGNPNRESPGYSHYSNIIRSLIEQILGSLSSQTNLRIIELGTGVSYATEELLSVLSSEQTNYTFADVGNSFLSKAKEKFGQYPFIKCRAVDINKPFTEQEYSEGSFDIAIASKSLHIAENINATLKNISSLLAPGGILLIWEKTLQTLDIDMTWALLMDSSQKEERSKEERSLDNLYLSQEQWQEALLSNGFIEIAAVPKTRALGQQLLIAQTDVETRSSIPSAFTKILEPTEGREAPQISSDKKPDIADWFYIPSWKRGLPLQLSPSEERKTQLGCCLVFVNECSLGTSLLKRLETEGEDVVIVKIGEQFNYESDSTKGKKVYTINPRKRDDYDTLIEELIALDLLPKTIVHLWSLTPQNCAELTLENLDRVQEQGFYSLLFLAQALGKQNVTSKLEISVICDNLQSVTGEGTIFPEKATLLGSVKVIPQEYPNISCRSIDVILPEPGSWQEKKLVDCLLAEFYAKDSERVVAYRGIHRWLPALEQVQLDETFDGTSRLRQGGVYLITGGLGAIGLEFALHLAKTVQAKLILIGRSAFPAKEEWSEWLKNHDRDDKISCKIDRLKELEEFGAEVSVAQADVADLEVMQHAITQGQEQFGQINGVFHAAGVLGNGAIALKTNEDAEIVLKPKVQGTLVLNAIFQDVKLDFMILCSSRASIAPVAGQISYSSANNFLDAFAHYKAVKDQTFTVSVNLMNAWLEGGMSIEVAKKLAKTPNVLQSKVDFLDNGYSPLEGIEVFSRILGSTLPQVIVSTTDLQFRSSNNTATSTKTVEDSQLVLTTQPSHSRPKLNNTYIAPRNEVETKLANIWQEILGIEKVGIYDNFFELRGDSLLGIRVISMINQRFQINLSANSLFEAPIIEKLALTIEQVIIEELEGFTEEEAQEFLSGKY